ncbi:universal stress protein [Aquimarina aggregata]|uniref:universal stress protein n=1 Tax=Aquimarina aggregata TaxID=1642818 RepID=UPI00248F9B37|nr:universal stress protein [Aquimarina aggregata]
MKRILVPTDFSNNAYSALFYATQLFQDEACHFFILNTFDVETPVLTSRLDKTKGELLYKRLSKESNEKLIAVKHAIVRDTEDFNHHFETISVSKKLTETVNKTIKNKDIDLVVMGTKGASGLKEVFIGSNTVKVIQKIKDCPVLMIPVNFDFQKPTDIAFATGFKTIDNKALQPLLEITKLFDATIRVIHIHENEKLNQEQEENFKILKGYLNNHKYNMHWVSNFTKKSEIINEFIDKMNVNMLVMLKHRHGLIESVTREAVVKKIGFKATIPFLVIPAVMS